MSFISVLFGSNASKHEAISVLSPQEFKEKLKSNPKQLIDVRTPQEFKSGHIKGAKNIDFFSGRFNLEFEKLDKDQPVFLYCRSGNRSRQTSKRLAMNGFTKIYDLQGGIMNYQ